MIHLVNRHRNCDGTPFDYLGYPKRSVPARLVLGDIRATHALIQTSDSRQRCTSIVLSFDGDVSEEMQNAIIDSYEITAFAGAIPKDFTQV